MTADGVRRYLITADFDRKMSMWAATAMRANWLEGRPNGDRETWFVTVYAEHAETLLEAARKVGVTVEELRGAGDDESYELLVGEPGSGWQGAIDRGEITTDEAQQ